MRHPLPGSGPSANRLSEPRIEPGAFPIAEQIANEFLSLPMFPELTEAQIEFVIETVTETISAGAIA